MEYLNQSGKSKLLTNNMKLLLSVNFLLYFSVYMLLPVLPLWVMERWNVSFLQAHLVTAVYALAMFLPGVLNNYLVDHFRRKNVLKTSMLAIALLSMLYPHMTFFTGFVLLRAFQGACFSMAVMATGSTLVIDITPSSRRTSANIAHTWVSRLGMFAGVATGLTAFPMVGMPQILYTSALLSLVAIVLLSMVNVCFRAPLGVSLFSMDRFLLPRTFLPGVNMLALPFILGAIIQCRFDGFFYLCMAGGWLVYMVLRVFFLGWVKRRVAMLVGVGMVVAALFMLDVAADDGLMAYGAAFVIGLGMASSVSHFLLMMVSLPLHCERGTGYNTYELLWELGLVMGFVFEAATPGLSLTEAGIVALVALLFYEAYTVSYFNKKMKNRHLTIKL